MSASGPALYALASLLSGVFTNEEQVYFEREAGRAPPPWVGVRVDSRGDGSVRLRTVDAFGRPGPEDQLMRLSEEGGLAVVTTGACVRRFRLEGAELAQPMLCRGIIPEGLLTGIVAGTVMTAFLSGIGDGFGSLAVYFNAQLQPDHRILLFLQRRSELSCIAAAIERVCRGRHSTDQEELTMVTRSSLCRLMALLAVILLALSSCTPPSAPAPAAPAQRLLQHSAFDANGIAGEDG